MHRGNAAFVTSGHSTMLVRAAPRHAPRIARAASAVALLGLSLTGCAPTQFEATSDVPAPLIEKIPVTVGVYLPLEFREKVYEEKRDGDVRYSVGLGKAQSAGFMKVLDAMFTRVVPVAASNAGAATDPQIRGVLVPVLEDFAFVTPMDAGTPMYAASLRYKIELYSPTGELTDTWSFTGYGTQPAGPIPGGGDEALQAATRAAMRDAAAKLAAEFREQAIARGLLPAAPGAPAEVVPQAVPREL